MATKTKTEAPKTAAPTEAPPAQLPAKPKVSGFESFLQEFDAPGRRQEITALLPMNVPYERFRSCAIAAVKQNPEILTATPRSIFNALTKAAQDGLLPDGREGFINVYSTKQKGPDGCEVWLPTAQWLPMTHGIRKRARELDQLIIDAQVVYLNDRFEWHQGDDPKIVHVPVQPGKGDRGEKVGAYAIFKRENGLILHREVMDYGEIEKARKQSKSPDGMLWGKFPEEAYRKTAVRRGSKTVPVSDNLRSIFQRDDDMYDFTQPEAGQPQPTDTLIPPRPRESEFQRREEPKPEPIKPKPPATPTGSGPDGRPEPPPLGEPVETPEPPQDAPSEPEERENGTPEAEVLPPEGSEPEIPPSEAYMAATNQFDEMEGTIAGEKDLDAFKRGGRDSIENLAGVTDDERDMLRGRFTTMVLAEQKRRAGKAKR